MRASVTGPESNGAKHIPTEPSHTLIIIIEIPYYHR